MAHNIHLYKSTVLFGGTTQKDFDFGNSGGSSPYVLLDYIRGEPKFKETWSDSPLTEGARLTSYQLDDVDEEIHVAIEATSLDLALYHMSQLDAMCTQTREMQVLQNASGESPSYFWLSDKPRNASTKTYKYHIKTMDVVKPRGMYGSNLLQNIIGEPDDPIIIRLKRHNFVSASTLTVLNGVSADNGAGDYVDMAASGATAVTGDLPAPLSVKVVGGSALTNRVLMGVRTRGVPANFKQVYWAKDATITGSYTVTNAVLTANVATLTIGTHTFKVGDRMTAESISLDAAFDGNYALTAVTSTTISYARVNADIGSGASTGSVTGETVSLTGNYTVTNAALTGNVATLEIGTHNHIVGDTVVNTSISLDPVFDGTFVLSAVGATTISFPCVHADIGAAASTGTVSGELDGNGTGNGTRTTLTSTDETRTHRFVNTTNVADQFVRAGAWARMRSNTAGRYSARLKSGITDGTNEKFPDDENDGYLTAEAQAVGTHTGNNWAWVYLGDLTNPAIESGGATLYGLIFDLALTCSDLTGNPTLDVDAAIWLFPVGEGPVNTGMVAATFDFGTAASGVSSAIVSALPFEPQATLANGSDVATFPTVPDVGQALYALPEQAARLFIVLLDANDTSNPMHDYTQALTVTVKHELRHAAMIGVP